MTDLILRAATPADIPTLYCLGATLRLERIEHRFHLTEASLHKALFAPLPCIVWTLADSDNTILGFALWLDIFGTISGPCGMFVDKLFVAEPYRSRGIGLALFRHIARIATQKQYSVVQWDVNRLNRRAIEFYRRLGVSRADESVYGGTQGRCPARAGWRLAAQPASRSGPAGGIAGAVRTMVSMLVSSASACGCRRAGGAPEAQWGVLAVRRCRRVCMGEWDDLICNLRCFFANRPRSLRMAMVRSVSPERVA